MGRGGADSSRPGSGSHMGGVLLVDERQAKGTFPFPLVRQAELIRDFQEDVQVPEGAPGSDWSALSPGPLHSQFEPEVSKNPKTFSLQVV